MVSGADQCAYHRWSTRSRCGEGYKREDRRLHEQHATHKEDGQTLAGGPRRRATREWSIGNTAGSAGSGCARSACRCVDQQTHRQRIQICRPFSNRHSHARPPSSHAPRLWLWRWASFFSRSTSFFSRSACKANSFHELKPVGRSSEPGPRSGNDDSKARCARLRVATRRERMARERERERSEEKHRTASVLFESDRQSPRLDRCRRHRRRRCRCQNDLSLRFLRFSTAVMTPMPMPMPTWRTTQTTAHLGFRRVTFAATAATATRVECSRRRSGVITVFYKHETVVRKKQREGARARGGGERESGRCCCRARYYRAFGIVVAVPVHRRIRCGARRRLMRRMLRRWIETKAGAAGGGC